MRAFRVSGALLLTGLAVGCGSSTPTITTTTTTLPPTTATSMATTTTIATTTSAAPVETELTIELPTVSELGADWALAFTIPYGDAEEELGTSPYGDGDLYAGPEYGAQAPDGTWWFLDSSKFRLAHYSEAGDFVGSEPLGPDLLSHGQYFQYQLPHILDDGTLVANRLDIEVGEQLIMDGDGLRVSHLAEPFVPRIDDGTTLYGFTFDSDMVAVDPPTGDIDTVEWFRTTPGVRFRTQEVDDGILVELPDAGERVRLHLVYAGDPSLPAWAAFEVAGGADGTLFLLLYGGTELESAGQLGGFLSISPEGVVSPLEAIRNPFSDADPSSPAHLGVRPGTSTPWLMFIDLDGVRVFVRS